MYLRSQNLLEFRRIHVNAIPRGVGRGGYKTLSRNIDMEGMPDLEVYLNGGRILHVECKSDTGKLSPAQKLWKERLEILGHPYLVARSPDDLVGKLKEFGIDRVTLF